MESGGELMVISTFKTSRGDSEEKRGYKEGIAIDARNVNVRATSRAGCAFLKPKLVSVNSTQNLTLWVQRILIQVNAHVQVGPEPWNMGNPVPADCTESEQLSFSTIHP